MRSKKTILWILATLAILIVIALGGGYFYFQSDSFRRLAIDKIVAETNQATGGRAQIAALDFQLSTLTAHLYKIVLRGNEPPAAPPLFQVDELTVRLKLESVFHRKVTLRELILDHPALVLDVNQKGENNIPQTPPGKSAGNTSIFDLAIRRFAINRGEVTYNDVRTPLEADLHDLKAAADYASLLRRYRGSLSYTDGRVRWGLYAPMSHSLSVSFSATPSGLTLESAVMNLATSTATLHGEITGYTNPRVSADYDIRMHTADFAAITRLVKPAGALQLQGKLVYENQPNRSMLRNVTIHGEIGSDALSATSPDGRIELRKLRGQYQLANNSFQAEGIETELLGGSIKAAVFVRNLDTTPVVRVHALLSRISLHAAQLSIRKREVNQVALTGLLDGTADANWSGSTSNIKAKSDLTLWHSALPSHLTRAIPVEGEIHAAYDSPKNVLAVRQTVLQIPSAVLTAEGQLSRHSRLRVGLNVNDLHQLVSLVSALRPTSTAAPAISGAAMVNATIAGSVDRPQISGSLVIRNLQVEGSNWKSAQLSIQASSSRVAISNGVLTNADHGHASFAATIGLRDWAYFPSSRIDANLSLRQMRIADLQHLANLHYPVSGELSANLSLSGSQTDPRGSGSLDITKAQLYGEPVQNFAANFHAENGSIESTLKVTNHAGSVAANLAYTPEAKAYQFHLDASGIALDKLHTIAANSSAVRGILVLSASGQGTLDNPQLTATAQLSQLQVQQKPLGALKGTVQVANQRADLSVDSQLVDATVRGHARVNLTGNYETNASLDTSAVSLAPLVAKYSTAALQGFQGQTELHATLNGPLKDKTKLEAHLTIPTFQASYQTLQIGATGPIHADYSHSVLTLQPAELRGTDTSIRIHGSIPLAGAGTPTLTAQGTIDARIFRIADPDLKSAGKIDLDIRTAESTGHPELRGQIHLQDLSLATDAFPLGIDKVNGTLDLNHDQVQISHLVAEVGGGEVSAHGSVTYRPSPQFDIALNGKSIRLRYPTGLRSTFDTDLTWGGTLQSSTLTGRVLVDALAFTPDFDLASFGDQFSSNVAVPSQPGFADTINLHVGVQSKDNLNATSTQISISGNADLQVLGTAANPVVTGRTDLTSGELFYRNVRYQLQRGIITFDDPNQTRPVLNVSVTTNIEQYNLTLNLRGPFDTLTTSYTSDPPLATADIINLIARGKTSTELAGQSQSTDSMLASQAASALGGSVQKLAGLSSLQIDPELGGNNANPSARVGFQQRVTRNFLFSFSTDLTQPGQEIVQGEYQINKRWSVSVTRDQLGGVAVDGRLHTKF